MGLPDTCNTVISYTFDDVLFVTKRETDTSTKLLTESLNSSP